MRIIKIDSQRLTAIMSCFRQANYSYILNKRGFETSVPIQNGDVTHKMLEMYYRNKILGMPFKDNVDASIAIGEFHAVTHAQISGDQILILTEYFKQYCEYYKNETWIPKEVEAYFAFDLYEDSDVRIIYEGKIDLIVEQPGVPGLIVVDHKTTSRRSIPSKLSNQFMGYCVATGNNNMMVNEYGLQASYKNPKDRLHRHLYSYSQSLLDEWRHIAVDYVLRFDQAIQDDHFPPNFTSCDKYSGCIFRDVCGSIPEAREFKLATEYKTREWDPAKDERPVVTEISNESTNREADTTPEG